MWLHPWSVADIAQPPNSPRFECGCIHLLYTLVYDHRIHWYRLVAYTSAAIYTIIHWFIHKCSCIQIAPDSSAVVYLKSALLDLY